MRKFLAVLSSVAAALAAISAGQSDTTKAAPVFIHCGTLIDGKSE